MYGEERMSEENTQLNIAVDLDGTLARYDGFVSSTFIGEPLVPMLAAVRRAIDAGHNVWIYTARLAPIESWMPEAQLSPPEQYKYFRSVEAAIGDWCEKHIGIRLPMTGVKLRIFHQFWDDRAYRVDLNIGTFAMFQSLP